MSAMFTAASSAFRFRNDNGTSTTATWMAAQNVEPSSILVDIPFRLRFRAGDTGGASGTLTPRIRFQRGGSGGWNEITDSTPVKFTTSPHVANGTATTSQLTGGLGGAFVAGQIRSDNNHANVSLGANGNTESEWVLVFDPVQVDDLEIFTFQIYNGNSALGQVTAQVVVSDPLQPPATAPTLSAGTPTHDTIPLSWTSVTDAETYELQRDLVTIQNTAALTRNDSGLNPQTQYSYRVRAVNAAGNGPWSSTITPTTASAGVPIPIGFSATFVGSDRVDLEWQPVTEATGYDIERVLIPTAELLTWAPPTLGGVVNVTEWQVSGSMGGQGSSNRTLDAGGNDVVIVFNAPVTRRLQVFNARHVVVIGGEFNIDTEWTLQQTNYWDDRWCLDFRNCSGIVHVEGVKMGGAFITEGINVGRNAGTGSTNTPILQVQNCRIGPLLDPGGATGPDTWFHSDAIQCWGGVAELRLDLVTMISQYQNLMFRTNWNAGGPVHIRRTDMFGHGVQQEFYLKSCVQGLNTDNNPNWGGDVTWGGDGSYDQRVYATRPSSSRAGFDYGHNDFGRVSTPTVTGATIVQERPLLATEGGRQYLHWPNSGVNSGCPKHIGRLWEGPRPEGDWCPANVPGMAYTSPGYQS